MKIFAYLKNAGMTPEILSKLSDAGYIPVPVKSMDSIRIIESLPDGAAGAVFAAALEAIRDATYSEVREKFAAKLAKKLAPPKIQPTSDTRDSEVSQQTAVSSSS